MRVLKSIVLTVLLLFACHLCRAQFYDWWKDYRYGIHAAYSWQGSSCVELGVYRMWKSDPPLDRRTQNWDYEPEKHWSWQPLGFWSTGASIEVPLTNEFMIGPKLFTEFNASLLSIGCGAASFTNFHQMDVRVTPGIGLSLVGIVGVRYERSISLVHSPFEELNANRITVFINIITDDFPAY